MTPWFLPVFMLAQTPAAPLRLATPDVARIEVAAIDVSVSAPSGRPRRVRRDPFADLRGNMNLMELRARELKNRAASPAAVCNGSVCAIPVLQQLTP